MSQKTDKIYDRIFKRMLTLSSGLVIGLINDYLIAILYSEVKADYGKESFTANT